jgi:enoyl-CoA hydratase/carnithine racemase
MPNTFSNTLTHYTFSELKVAQSNHVLVVTLNRPDIHNAISHQKMVNEIESVCEFANQSSDIRAMILTGEGKSFCAGGNVKDMHNKTGMFAGNEQEIEAGYKNGIQRIPLALWHVEVPVIAAVNGAAVGAGCDLAMMCDIRVSSSTARFAESFVRLGIIPGDGGAWFLPRVIGAARAAQMTLTGEMVDAERALEWGIVTEVTAPEDLIDRAMEIAQSIAKNPPLAVRTTKHLLRQSAQLELTQMLDLCANTQAKLHQTNDHKEAVKALLEKRDGHYQGN